MNRCRISSSERFEIGRRMKAARLKARLTQAELAEIAMVHKSSITNWESGARMPDYRGLILVCRTCKVKSDWILGVKL